MTKTSTQESHKTRKSHFKTGQTVSWHWGNGEGTGKVVEVFERPVARTLKGAHVKKNGSPDCPALLIEQEDGDKVLKLASEIT